MPDAQEQAQAAEAPETVAAETTAAPETSAPTTQQTEPTRPTTVEDLDAMADAILNPKDPEATPEAPKAKESDPETDPEQEAAPDTKPPDRVRLSSLKDTDKALVNTAVQMVRDGLAEDVQSAILKITGKPAAATEPTKESTVELEPEVTVDPYVERIDGKRAEIKDVLAALTAAKKDFNDELETELTDKLLDLKSDVKMLEYRCEQEAEATKAKQLTEAEQTYQSYYDDYRSQAEALYPDAANPESELFAQIQEDVAWFEKNNPAIFNTPNYPLLIAGGAAAKIGKAPVFATKEAASAAQAPAAPSPNARVAARPVNPLVGGSATTVSSDTRSAARQVESIRSLHELDALAEATFTSR